MRSSSTSGSALPATRAALELGSVVGAGVDAVPAALVVLAPARSHGGFRAVVGLAVGVVDEAVAASTLRRPGACVVLLGRRLEKGWDGSGRAGDR